MKTSHKGFIAPLLLALIALLLVGGGVYVYLHGTQVKQSEVFNQTAATSTTQTSDWKVYHNQQYGFEISYPASYTFENSADESRFSIAKSVGKTGYAPRSGVIIGGVQKHASLYNGDIIDFVKTNLVLSGQTIEDIQSIQLGTLKGARVTSDSEDGLGTQSKTIDMYAINPTQPDLYYFVRFWQYDASDTEKIEFEKILSTFKINL